MIEISELLPNEYEKLNLKSKLRLFRFTGEEHKNVLTYEKLSLNSSQTTIIRQLLLASSTTKGLTLKSFANILKEKRLKFAPESIRRIIGELKQRKVIEEVEVTLHGNLLKQPRCFQFCDIAETIREADEREFAKLKDKSVNEKRSTDIVAQREALERRGLSLDDCRSDKAYFPSGAMYSDGLVLKEIQEISPDRANGIKFRGRTFDNNSGKFHLEAKAPDQIATKGAIATLVVIINIAVAYNSKMLTQRRFQVPFEHKEFPVHIVDILELRGIKDSGQARKRIRNQISWLRETIYRASDLKGILDRNLTKIFKQSDYQFFIQVTSNADEAPVIENDKAKASPNLYFITFNPILEKELCEEETFFSLPWRLMQASELLLFVYINFRRRKIEDEVITLEVLRELMCYEANADKFQEKLEKELNAGGFNLDGGDADFNLCGYYIKKSVNQSGEQQYRITCNEVEMIEESGAIGNRSTPEIVNPLKLRPDQIASTIKTAEEMKVALNHQSAYQEFVRKYVVKHTLRTKHFRRLSFGNEELAVTYYDSDQIINSLAKSISGKIGGNADIFLEFTNAMRSELHPVKFGEQEVSYELFWDLIEFLKDRGVTAISPVGVLEVTRTYRKLKVMHWVNREFDQLVADFL
ncbi:replication initiator protein RctB domain-containing protein [Vibrio sp. D431a]|uniref:replication initiator protein RctB domain-containing protein n=1 Tax=Vibrio sp. D431a TaxID=2837388 RepID=UPI002552CCDC|nr:replication initiator protein RctB domain-containing protein [Vibrio sp. D431a]MDK9789896.1 DUF3346 domain-containing protein [Vibrio sp. D431a]